EAILSADLLRMSQSKLTEEIASRRGTTLRKLERILKGDLETIVFKALKREPRERYVSVAELAHDIDNYLRDAPVTAHADGNLYRFGKFVVRHKLPVTAAAIALCAIVAGAAVAAWQARQATQERDRAVAIS